MIDISHLMNACLGDWVFDLLGMFLIQLQFCNSVLKTINIVKSTGAKILVAAILALEVINRKNFSGGHIGAGSWKDTSFDFCYFYTADVLGRRMSIQKMQFHFTPRGTT